MKTILSIMFASAVSSVVAAQAPAQQPAPKIDEFKMITYHAVFVTKGPSWKAGDPALEGLKAKHRAYITGLLRDGRAVIGGPFSGDADLRGAYIVPGSAEQAAALASADPGVEAGWWAFEIIPWMGPEGWFAKAADLAQTEKIYFGFLINGPDRSQDQPTAQALQRQHLDYMDGQSKMGKLVLAGPLNAPKTPRRGLIGYRVASMEEAKERASQDPAVKAGRLAVELYEWTVPKGILK